MPPCLVNAAYIVLGVRSGGRLYLKSRYRPGG